MYKLHTDTMQSTLPGTLPGVTHRTTVLLLHSFTWLIHNLVHDLVFKNCSHHHSESLQETEPGTNN